MWIFFKLSSFKGLPLHLWSPLNFMAVFSHPSIWLFPITVETLLSIGFCFTAQTARLHKLVGNLYVFQVTFSCRRQGSKRICLKWMMTVKKKRIIIFERKHNLDCLFVPFLNLFNSKVLECFCSAI